MRGQRTPEIVPLAQARGAPCAVTPLDLLEQREMQRALCVVLFLIDARERLVLGLRYGLYDGRSWLLHEIGKVMNVSTERVRQIEARGLRKLKHPSRCAVLSGQHADYWWDDEDDEE